MEVVAQLDKLQPLFEEEVLSIEAALGQERASLVVDEMRKQMVEAVAEVHNAHDFTGIINQGATCYMNSLLQALYMTPELRFALYRWEWNEGRGESKDDSIPYQLQKV